MQVHITSEEVRRVYQLKCHVNCKTRRSLSDYLNANDPSQENRQFYKETIFISSFSMEWIKIFFLSLILRRVIHIQVIIGKIKLFILVTFQLEHSQRRLENVVAKSLCEQVFICLNYDWIIFYLLSFLSQVSFTLIFQIDSLKWFSWSNVCTNFTALLIKKLLCFTQKWLSKTGF